MQLIIQQSLFCLLILFGLTAVANGQSCWGGYTPSTDAIDCEPGWQPGDFGIPCCAVAEACNSYLSPCPTYDPAFSGAAGCDMSCVGSNCFDSAACNYMGENECFYPLEGFDCDGNCFYDSDGDGEFESEVCCNSIGLEFWGNNDGGIYPTSQSLVQGLEADLEFVLNIPGTFEEPSTGTSYSVDQFVIEEVSGLPSWAEEIDLVGDTIDGEEQVCIPISGIPISVGEYEIQVSGIYTVLIFGLPFEIDAVEYSALINVTENPNPIQGCTYELAANFLAYATIDDGSCEFDGCASSSALNYVPYGNGSEPCIYSDYFCGDPAALNYVSFGTGNSLQCLFEDQVCGAGLSWNTITNACEVEEAFLEAIAVNSCGDGTSWSPELGQCFPVGLCPEDLNSDGVVGVADLLQLLSTFGEYCEESTETVEFTCGDPMNYHGYDYATVQIGEQCWFAENLRTELYQNGDGLQADLSNLEWTNANFGAQCIYENNDENLGLCGRLYNWHAVNDERGVCPSNWHVPSQTEWFVLVDYAAPESGLKLKADSSSTPAWNGTDYLGFSATAAGRRDYATGQFLVLNEHAYWWTGTQTSGDRARLMHISSELTAVESLNYFFEHGFSVRCIQDTEE